MSRVARSIEELFPIIALVRAGDLKGVGDWIAAGSPLNLPMGKKTKRRSPLQIAIEKGYLTMVEILLKGGADPVADCALRLAVESDRVDIVGLLLEHGSKIDDIRFEDVCHGGNHEMIRLFPDKGAERRDLFSE